MIKKLLQYKRMIGNATLLARQNHELLLQNHELLQQNHELLLQNRRFAEQMLDQMYDSIDMQNEIAAVNTAAFASYKNINAGKDVVVLGAGPTLDKYVPLEGAVHIGVNKVCTSNIKLDYYFMQDFRHEKTIKGTSYDKAIDNLTCKKFLGLFANIETGLECSNSFCARVNGSRYYVDGSSPTGKFYQDICYHPLKDYNSVIFPALHFAFYTNPNKIFLVGCDTSYSGYFSKGRQPSSVEDKRLFLRNTHIGFNRLKEFAQRWYPETEIVSINPVNLKGLFRDVYTNEHGALVDCTDETAIPDFSDEAIENLVDRHIESVLLERLSTESLCKTCKEKTFSLVRGISDSIPENIEVKCNGCGDILIYPQPK